MGGDAEQVLTAVEFEGVSVEGDSQCVDVTIFQDFDMEPIEFFFLGLFPISGQTVPLTIDPQRMFSTVNIIDSKAIFGSAPTHSWKKIGET